MSRVIGQHKEALVKDLLCTKGWKFLAQNYTCRWGEVDLIFCDKEKTIVFVEVRYRSRRDFGTAANTVTWHKQQKLIKTAMTFIQQNQLQGYNFRFDVAALEQTDIHYITHAFAVDGGVL